MKKFIVGCLLIFMSLLLTGFVMIAVSVYTLNEKEYNTFQGRYGTSFFEIGFLPSIVLFLMFTIGLWMVITSKFKR